jgi:hypothetical protein
MTPAKAKRHSVRPSRSGLPSNTSSDDPDQLSSGTRIKRADPTGEREAIEASIDAAFRELDSLESPVRKKAPGRRVPPFPGTGRTQALPLLPSVRPRASSRPKKGG